MSDIDSHTDHNLHQRFERLCVDLRLDQDCCVAVSGGSDSMALLRLLHQTGRRVIAVSVDHQLRSESRSEAEAVAKWCRALDIEHHILIWTPQKRTGNIQHAARQARYELLDSFCRRYSLKMICVGHTLDDQAETLVLRLMRGSGVDGLSSMRQTRTLSYATIVRPLLSFKKKELQAYLRSISQGWIEDPSNTKDTFDRVRVRRLLHELEVPSLRLIQTAEQLQLAQDVLEAHAAHLRACCITVGQADVYTLRRDIFFTAMRETQLRLLAQVLQDVSGHIYRPRWRALLHMHTQIHQRTQPGMTLHGCVIRVRQETILIFREYKACAKKIVIAPYTSEVWDNRWYIHNGTDHPITVGALGREAHAEQLKSRWDDIPYAAKKSALAVWSHAGRMLCIPAVGLMHPDIVIR